jgi:branched-chain amino acid transport system ATP-binding protein
MLAVNEISCFYGKVRALERISILVEDKAFVSILGSNGAGKSTVIRMISGLIFPTEGEILFNGERINGLAPDLIARRGIIQVPEGRMLFPELTVMENLRMGAYARKDRFQINKDFDKVFQYFPRLKERKNQMASTLSGGEQQMLAIARGLMGNPKILLLDEPSLGLAPIIVKGVFSIIDEISKAKIPILLVEQNAYIALKISHYAYILETGSITMEGDSKHLIKNEKILESYLGIKKGGE